MTSRTGEHHPACGDTWLPTWRPGSVRGQPNSRTPLVLSLIPTDQGRFRDGIFACLSLDVRARRIGLRRKMVGREGEQPEAVVVWPVTTGRTRTAVAGLSEIIDRLLYILALRGTDSKFRDGGRKIISHPIAPCAGERIGIVAEQDKTSRCGWHARPLQDDERFSPSQVKCRGIDAPPAKALETSFRALSTGLQETSARA